MVKTKKKEEKLLYIGMKEDIRNVVKDYCLEAGIDEGGIQFAMGYMSGAVDDNPIALQQLTFMLQAYFFAGVVYHNKHKSKMDIKRMTLKEFETLAQDKRPSNINPIKSSPSYVG